MAGWYVVLSSVWYVWSVTFVDVVMDRVGDAAGA